MNTIWIVVLVIGGGVLLCVAFGFLIEQFRMARHAGLSRDEFVSFFAKAGVALTIPSVVYDYYQSRAVRGRFKLAPNDTYEWLLEGDEEIEEDASDLLKQLKLERPLETAGMRWAERMHTVADMVFWLDSIGRQQSSGTLP